LRASRLRKVERVDPLALTPDELALMALLGPLLITSPRAVKRLANSYGLLAALQQAAPGGRTDLQPVPDPGFPDAYPYRAAMTLLATVIGFPDLGPVLFPALYHHALDEPDATWQDWVTSLRATPPPGQPGGWHHPLDAAVTPARADRWNHLVTRRPPRRRPGYHRRTAPTSPTRPLDAMGDPCRPPVVPHRTRRHPPPLVRQAQRLPPGQGNRRPGQTVGEHGS
jgi:hypothetical protein